MLSNLIAPVNINNSNCEIHLSKGIYDVYIIGGWEVKLGKFNFYLENINNNSIIKPQKSEIRTQDYFKRKKAKKVFSITVMNGGRFIIKFENQNNVVIYKTFLSPLLFWQKPIKTKDIEVKFERK